MALTAPRISHVGACVYEGDNRQLARPPRSAHGLSPHLGEPSSRLHDPRPGLSGSAFRRRRAPMDWATWRSPLARWSSPRRRAAGCDRLSAVISSSSLARSISLGPSAGRPTQATSRASQPARLPRTAGRRRSARAMFQMRPRTGGGAGPDPQAPPPTASPRRRVAGAVILQGWAGDPRRRAIPLPGLTAEAEPGSARLGLGWRFRTWLTSFGPVFRTHNVPCIHENIF
jgi:hypothetical protein